MVFGSPLTLAPLLTCALGVKILLALRLQLILGFGFTFCVYMFLLSLLHSLSVLLSLIQDMVKQGLIFKYPWATL